ncbi:hypothetical protein [Humidisolicoccus flavus]|uniref:hypothetical protein n=1 Tax=Humidisolicoccus flavus TaxID=3111414 RepID=UPI0032562180
MSTVTSTIENMFKNAPEPPAPKRRKRRAGVATALGLIAMTLGLGLLAAVLIVPDKVEQVYGNVKMTVEEQVRTVVEPGPPSVILGGEGDMARVDECDGTFTEMLPYRIAANLQPTFLAHNACSGDKILNWTVGQEVTVVQNGTETAYTVTDAVQVAKFGSTTDDIDQLAGSLLLQSCFYGVNKMQVVALTPVGEEAVTPPLTEEGPVELEAQ